MILCVGEILADMIGTENNGVFAYERKAGGAPFNVACAAKKLGASVAFTGCVGDDLIGKFLYDFAASRGFDSLNVCIDPAHNTTLAFVELDKRGERSFCFYRKGTADYMLPHIPDSVIDSASIVHVGSLMLSEKTGIDYAKALIERAHAHGKLVSFDVNFRTDIFRDTQTAVSIYKSILKTADIIKLSQDEAEIFTYEYVETELKDKLVCISLGEAGSEWRYKGKKGRAGTIKVVPVDTTGAGDAFYGGVLSKLDGTAPKDWSEGFLTDSLKFANVCGALNTLSRGAIDGLPNAQTVQSRI